MKFPAINPVVTTADEHAFPNEYMPHFRWHHNHNADHTRSAAVPGMESMQIFCQSACAAGSIK